jgi:hypothetical protein
MSVDDLVVERASNGSPMLPRCSLRSQLNQGLKMSL